MQIKTLGLKKLNNTRDLGGFPAEDGKKIKYGKLLRSGRLYKLPKHTKALLEQAGVTTVIDLRTETERQEYPDTVLSGAKYLTIPLLCTVTTGITYTKHMARTMLNESKRIKNEFGTADAYMIKMYESILFDELSQQRLKEFFDAVTKDENCVLWHCNAGKDRAGICAMLLESVLGVDKELIIKDYCASKDFQLTRRFWQRAGLIVLPAPRYFKRILIALMESKPQYIMGAIEKAEEKYGSVTEYCKQALGISEEQIQTLKNKYLE
ncbi:MAG: tyrosine-protein phosphatase [Clostridia bacterium]|nr:tyrosine-protein phosphatase [Clostridia bacterium]